MSKTSKKLDRNTIQRVLQLIRPYKGMVILTLTLAFITVVTTLLAPVLAGRAVDKIVGAGQVGALPMADECCQQPHYLSGRAGYAGARI